MNAYVLHAVNDLRYEKVETPNPVEDEVLVKVQAAGVCGSDIPRIYKNGTYSFPLIPGHEFSGIVVKAGEKVEDKWIGKRVGIFPLLPCYQCKPCQMGQFELCRHYSYLGSRTNGGFAQYVCVPWKNLIELSENVTFEQAAMLEPMAVAVHAMRQAFVQENQFVAIVGLGTIGLLLVMFLKAFGVKNIFVIGNKDLQKKQVLELGILEENYCDSQTQETGQWLAEKTNGLGVDVFFECVGKAETIKTAILNTTPGGTVQLVGNPASDILLEKEIYWKILRNQLTVKGSWNSSFLHDEEDDWHYARKLVEEKKVVPEKIITHKVSFDRLEQGLAIMKNKTEEYVKVMMSLDSKN